MTAMDAIFFRQEILPIIREAAEERGDTPNPLRQMLRQLVAYTDSLHEFIADLGGSGAEFEDPRLRYVVVQIDRQTWQELRLLVRDLEV